jgi:hypothetical protein
MIRNIREWQAWEDALIAGEAPDFARNLRLFEMMYEEALALGILPGADPLDGIEDTIHLVRQLHVSTTPPAISDRA